MLLGVLVTLTVCVPLGVRDWLAEGELLGDMLSEGDCVNDGV